MYSHEPVMLGEVLKYLDPKLGETIIDCTLGGAGYTVAISELVGKEGRVISFDLDPMAVENAKKVISEKKIENITLVHENFRNLADVLASLGVESADGVVMDLGLSSAQLADISRGFSFSGDKSLDMSFGDRHFGPETKDIVNRYSAPHLASLFRELGDEDRAWQIAQAIVREREKTPIEDSSRLAEIISGSVKKRFGDRVHPATKVFQALRMETNQELDSLREVLPAALAVLSSGGRLVAVSFHSGEDRIVKDFLRIESRDCLCPPSFPICRCGHSASIEVLTKKPIVPEENEVKANPRSRSAKLRAARKR